MASSIEINPINKVQAICSLLQKLNYQYEVHTANTDKDYEYLQGNDICITIHNCYCEYPLYIDLEDCGEFTLSYYKWHAHYFGEEWDYNRLCEALSGILKNDKCVIIVNSNKRWLSSGLSEIKIDETYNYKNDIKKLPKEFQDEIKESKGNVELFYWNIEDNVTINIK